MNEYQCMLHLQGLLAVLPLTSHWPRMSIMIRAASETPCSFSLIESTSDSGIEPTWASLLIKEVRGSPDKWRLVATKFIATWPC